MGAAMMIPLFRYNLRKSGEYFRIGIVGLDTSQVTMISTHINNHGEGWDVVERKWGPDLEGFRVVAAYPYGSRTIPSSLSQIPLYTERMREMGVQVTGSIEELLAMVDGVMLMTFDGHMRLEQSFQIMEAGKPLFINKPFGARLEHVVQIIEESRRRGVPIFSTSPTRYLKGAQAARSGDLGEIVGASTYSGAPLEPSHTDLFWYGIHGVEILFTIMGPECQTIRRIGTSHTDVVIGEWDQQRIGTYRGIRKGHRTHSGIIFSSMGIHQAGDFNEVGHRPLVLEMLKFFRTGTSPVNINETLAIHVFMEAADESKRNGGVEISMEETLHKAMAR